MNEEIDQINQIRDFTSPELGYFISVTIMEITIAIRDIYYSSTEGFNNIDKIQSLNESIHFLAGMLSNLCKDKRIDMECFLDSLNLLLSNVLIGSVMHLSIKRAMRLVRDRSPE